jgi:predicted ATP-binding protein involved in virulence
MKITKVTLQNFRGIGSLELEFPIDQSVITLVGVNGVGKSSILDAITMLLSTAWLLSYRNKHSQSSDQMRYPNAAKPSDIKINQELTFCKMVLSDSSDEGNVSIRKAYDSCKVSDYVAILSKMTEVLLIRYSSDRRVGLISSRSYRMNSNVSEMEKSAGFDVFFKWFKELEDIEHEEIIERDGKHRNKSLEAVRNAVYYTLGEGFSKLRVRRATNDLILNKEGTDISVGLLSDGEKSLIALVSDIAKNLVTTYPNMENSLEGEGIILIDEIELHMHPKWQRMIIPRLTNTFPNCQFIVTTHSPQVLSHVQPESIYLLKKVGEDIVVTKPQYSYGRDSNRILEDLMDETERPAEIQDQLAELFSLIHQGQLREAQQLVNQLAATIRAGEPELSKAEVMIKRREIIGR